MDWDITAPPYGGAVLPEADGDKPARSVDVFTVRDGLVAEKLAYVKG